MMDSLLNLLRRTTSNEREFILFWILGMDSRVRASLADAMRDQDQFLEQQRRREPPPAAPPAAEESSDSENEQEPRGRGQEGEQVDLEGDEQDAEAVEPER